MPLKNILAEVASDLGTSITSPTERAWLIGKINGAAKDLYDQNDLMGCLREQLFEIGSEDQQISLPYQVAEIRGCRDYDNREKMTLFDMSPRYQTEGWQDTGYQWRIKRQGAPTMANWLADGPITFTLSKPAATDFTINVVGETNQASRIQETVSVLAGVTVVSTTNVFVAGGIEAIFKSAVTQENIIVTSLDAVTIAEIPNHELYPSYTIIQVMDRDQSRSQTQLIEVLYKTRFTPMENDYDSIPCGDIYDGAIYWSTLAQCWAKNEGDQWVNKVLAANGYAQEIIKRIAENRQVGRTARMDFGINRFANLVWRSGPNRWSSRRRF